MNISEKQDQLSEKKCFFSPYQVLLETTLMHFPLNTCLFHSPSFETNSGQNFKKAKLLSTL